MNDLKNQVFEKAKSLLTEKMLVAKAEMEAAQASANTEDKSSAGDKYETGRAMAQRERDMYAKQFDQISSELAILNRIDPKQPSAFVNIGSLISTNFGYYFLSVSIGKLIISEQEITIISKSSPIGKFLFGKKVGENFDFLGKNIEIKTIF